MSANQRRQYRVGPEELRDVRLSVSTSERRYALGQPNDLSLDGVGTTINVGLGPSECPALAVGDEVVLHVALRPDTEPLELAARVAHRSDREGCRRYGFQLTDRGQLERQVPSWAYALFNQRRTYRVRPASDCPVDVMLTGPPGVQVRARLMDISAGGMALAAPTEAETVLAAAGPLTASVFLPDCGSPATLGVVIRHRRLVGREVHYGVEFDLERTRDAARQQDLIVQYVMARQREMLRVAGSI